MSSAAAPASARAARPPSGGAGHNANRTGAQPPHPPTYPHHLHRSGYRPPPHPPVPGTPHIPVPAAHLPASATAAAALKRKRPPVHASHPPPPTTHVPPYKKKARPNAAVASSSGPGGDGGGGSEGEGGSAPNNHPPPNAFDLVLGESHDLLQAAAEAQALGRLKNGAAYLLFAHARLVGLAKRFDRAVLVDEDGTPVTDHPPGSVQEGGGGAPSSSTGAAHPNDASCSSAGDISLLAEYLPSNANVDFDNAMMEHLARAAMELHNRRTGRGMQHEAQLQKRLKEQQQLSAPTSSSSTATKALPSQPPPPPPPGVAWTEEEKSLCRAAARRCGYDSVSSVVEAMGGTRSEAQVRVYLRNLRERERASKTLELSSPTAAGVADLVGNGERGGGGSVVSQSPSAAAATVSEGQDTPSKKKGGRGKKPPTSASHTVPNANLDARAIIMGMGHRGDGL